MPSKARRNARDYMIPEVEKILSAHKELRNGKKGPDSQKSILRSGVLFLCAAWEVYCEDVVKECADKILESVDDPEKLPNDMKAQLKAAVHHANVVESKPLRLAGLGWRTVYREEVESACRRFNTPRSDKLNDLFKKWVGFRDVSSVWSIGSKEIDAFVSVRGEIAHRGSESPPVTQDQLRHFKSIIAKSIIETDDALYEYLKGERLIGFAPWQKTQK